MKRRSLVLVSVLLVALVGTACSDDDDDGTVEGGSGTTVAGGQPAGGTVSVKTVEYNFVTPAQITGGLVKLELDNSGGKEPHEANLVRLDPGRTVTDLLAADPNGPPPPWAHAAGGPGPVSPGKRALYTANLQAGTYVLQCFVPAPDGVEHFRKGMVAQVTVSQGSEGALPAADSTIVGTEFAFTGTEGLKAGTQTVKVENRGQQPHNWALIAIAPGRTADDVVRFLSTPPPGAGSPTTVAGATTTTAAGATTTTRQGTTTTAAGAGGGPPPFTDFPGLVGAVPPGGSATRTLELTSGNYVFICFIADQKGPHFLQGMTKAVTIA